MPTDVYPIVDGEPNTPDHVVSALLGENKPPRLTPRVRSGYFHMGDRRHFLYAKKATCYLEDLTWYAFQLSDEVIRGSETVLVRGIDITGTDQYRFRGPYLLVNAGAFTHPGEHPGDIDHHPEAYSPYENGDIKNPNYEVRIDYDYYDWTAAGVATGSATIQDGVNAGLVFTPSHGGTWANAWTITIPAATGSAAAWTVNVHTQTLTLSDWDAASTTIQDVIDAAGGVIGNFILTHDGIGSPADLLNGIMTALGTPQSETFSGGTDESYTTTSITEIYDLIDGTAEYKFDELPTNGSPVVMTDDWMNHNDRRDISPEFSISEDGFIDFNVPTEGLWNSSFEGDPDDPVLWGTTGTVYVEQDSVLIDAAGDPIFTLGRAFSNSNYCVLEPSSTIKQTIPISNIDELYLSIRGRGAVDGTAAPGTLEDYDVTVRFYDNTWTVVGTDTFTSAHTEHDWDLTERSYGPSGRSRTYDYNPPSDAFYIEVEIASPATANSEIHIDYVSLVKEGILPDHWNPHHHISVEFDLGDDEYYSHQPNVIVDILNQQQPRGKPLESCNSETSNNSDTSGFLYLHEYDCDDDFQLGVGGFSDYSPGAPEITLFREWPGVNLRIYAIEPDGDGGYYIGGDFTQVEYLDGTTVSRTNLAHILSDGSVDANFQWDTNGVVNCLLYDDGDLYVGGSFSTINATARNDLAKIDTVANTLYAWNPNNSATSISCLAMNQARDVLYIGHGWNGADIGGVTRDDLHAIDPDTGTGIAGFDANVTGSSIDRLIVMEDDELIILGDFTAAGGGARDGFTVVDDTGSNTKTVASSIDTNTVLNGVLVGDVLYFVGNFTQVNGDTRGRGAAWDFETSTLLPWDPGVQNTAVRAIDYTNDILVLGGNFTLVQGRPTINMALVDVNSNLLEWLPNPSANVDDIYATEDKIVVGGNYTSVGARSLGGVSFFVNYDGHAVQGRRYLPYAKVDGLGKLRHRSELRYNAWPWTREVTYCDSPPVPGQLELIPNPSIVRFDIGHSLLANVSAGDEQVTLDNQTVKPIDGISVLHITQTVSEVTSFDAIPVLSESGGVMTLERPVRYAYGTGTATVDVDWVGLHGYTTDKTYVRLKLLDSKGAPLGQYPITYSKTAEHATFKVVEAAEETNQDGEWWCLIEFLSATTNYAEIEFTAGDITDTLRIKVETLP